MSTQTTISILDATKPDTERGHRRRLQIGYALAAMLVLGLAVYGFDYYFLDFTQRPFSSKHLILKPSGLIGLWLGILGVLLFLGIFLYPLRKRWDWLRRQGNTKHWLDFHVLLGLTAPFVVAFHSSFKFRGLAGMAFWIMAAVVLSGIVGRYLFAQIPRSLNAAELSLKEAQDLIGQQAQQLTSQRLIPPVELASLFALPSARDVETQPLLQAFLAMVALDAFRVARIARLRRRATGTWGAFITFGGLVITGNRELERVIEIARRQAALSKRILFFSRSQQVFHLWHVVHKPFSYSFAVLVVLHILVVMLFGVL